MKDYELEVLEQYDIDVKNVRKGRGSYFLDTDCGDYVLQSTRMSEQKAGMLQQVYEHLQENGYRNVDKLLRNCEGNLVSSLEDGSRYVVKHWFSGRECNVQKDYEITEAVKNLAFLHNILVQTPDLDADYIPIGSNIENEFQRYNQKLKKVRSFIRKRPAKTEFEMAFLKYFNQMYEMAERAAEKAGERSMQELYESTHQKKMLVHGDYNYHNILMLEKGIATVHFENFCVDVQARDLYYFMRKILEKNRWDRHLGEQIIRSYGRIHPLELREMNYLALRLAYPEKFYKVANNYYQSNKAKIPEKGAEKLLLAVQESEKKKRFLADLFTFYL